MNHNVFFYDYKGPPLVLSFADFMVKYISLMLILQS